jgi:hypothetical protein
MPWIHCDPCDERTVSQLGGMGRAWMDMHRTTEWSGRTSYRQELRCPLECFVRGLSGLDAFYLNIHMRQHLGLILSGGCLSYDRFFPDS